MVEAPRKGGEASRRPSPPSGGRALDAYIEAAGLEEPKAALFQSMDPAARRLTGRALERRVALAMIKRRAAAAGLPPSTCYDRTADTLTVDEIERIVI